MRNNPNRQPRCPRCRMTWSLCVCDLAPRLSLRTRVAVIMHVSEIMRSSNTGHIVPMVLANSFVCLRGIKDRPTETAGMVPAGSQGLVLYPSSDSQELTADYLRSVRQPVTLVVLDGNWRQAGKMVRHEPGLDGLPRVRLAAGPASRFRLRAQLSPARKLSLAFFLIRLITSSGCIKVSSYASYRSADIAVRSRFKTDFLHHLESAKQF